MSSFLLALLGITGTATSAIAVTALQNRAASSRAAAESKQRMDDLQRQALADFAQQVMEFRRTQLITWHEVHGDEVMEADHDAVPSADRTREQRSKTWGAFYRLRLVWTEDAILRAAEQLLDATTRLKDAASAGDLAARADNLRNELSRLTDSARGALE